MPGKVSPDGRAIGDLDQDGFSELAVANKFPTYASVLLGSGDGTFGSAMKFGVGAAADSVVIGDLNQDGVPDLASADRSGDRVSVILNRILEP